MFRQSDYFATLLPSVWGPVKWTAAVQMCAFATDDVGVVVQEERNHMCVLDAGPWQLRTEDPHPLRTELKGGGYMLNSAFFSSVPL